MQIEFATPAVRRINLDNPVSNCMKKENPMLRIYLPKIQLDIFSTWRLLSPLWKHLVPPWKEATYWAWRGVLPRVWLLFPGLQDVLPEFLRGRFVEAALSYVACNSEGELLCRNNDCWCQCSPRFPECNCPFADIKVMEENLEKSKVTWNNFNQEFMESGMGSLSWLSPL